MAPLVIREKYLRDKDYVKTSQIYDSMLRTPGERRTIGNEALEEGFKQGVVQGLFGLGELEVDKPVCRFFKEDPGMISFGENEILIKDAICLAQREAPPTTALLPPQVGIAGGPTAIPASPIELRSSARNNIKLTFKVPMGRVSQIMGLMNYLQSKFKNLQIEITADEGSISTDDYRNKVIEALRQLGIDFEEEG